MKVRVQIIIEHEEGETSVVEEVACLCRGDLLPETLGLTLAEGKHLLATIQEKMVSHQAAEYVDQQRACPQCGRRGAHLLLQVRTQVLNEEWRETFCRWYPEMTDTEDQVACAA